MAKYMAIDCEMVETFWIKNALARVSIVDENSRVVLDEYVIPPGGCIIDYRTRWSGITKELIGNKGKEMSEVQSQVREILKDAVIIGHTVNTDLKSLMRCPCKAIVDISELPQLKLRFWRTANPDDPDSDEELIKRQRISLKRLSTALLDRQIQTGNKGHSSVEDATATMDLFRLIQKEWELKNPDLAGEDLFDDKFWEDEESLSEWSEEED